MSENPGGHPPSDDQPNETSADGLRPEPPAVPEQPEPPAPPVGASPPPGAAQPGPTQAGPPQPGPTQPGAGAYPPPGQGAYPPPAAGAYPPPAPGAYQPPGQGAYPPPAPGAYPPPAAGAYPPPGAGSYQPAAAYPAGTGSVVDVGQGLSWAWTAFARNWVALVFGVLLWWIAVVIVWTVLFAIFGGFSRLSDRVGNVFLMSSVGFGGVVALAVAVFVAGLFYATFIRAGLRIADGETITFGDLFDFKDVGQAFVLALLFAAADFVANLIPFFGWLVLLVAFYFAFFAFHALVQQKLTAVDAIKASIAIQTRDIGSSILVYVLTGLIAGVGFVLCGVGALVTVPLAMLFSVFAYRRLINGPVAQYV